MEQIKAIELSRKLRVEGSKKLNELPWVEYLEILDKATEKYQDKIKRNSLIQKI